MHKNAQTLSEKLGAKCPATTRGHSMVKIACLDNAFLKFFLPVSKPSIKSLTTAQKKNEKKEITKT